MCVVYSVHMTFVCRFGKAVFLGGPHVTRHTTSLGFLIIWSFYSQNLIPISYDQFAHLILGLISTNFNLFNALNHDPIP